jgi:putative N6-adenine-specific DNA methylase
LGLTPGERETGGVVFDGGLVDLARANLWLRTASRVLVRVAAFHARALGELERKAAALAWREWLPPGVVVQLRVSSRKSRLYHQKAIAERVAQAIQTAGWEVRTGGAGEQESEEGQDPAVERPEQLVAVRLFRDECGISLDSSGALLHRRGYRLATAKAPLRETLAAALLIASGWTPAMPLLDPFAGSGTIPIEAALMARRIPPGRHRRFAFQRWPGWNTAEWEALLAQADRESLPVAPATIVASDRDAGAVRATLANAERAGVSSDLLVRQAALSSLDPPPGPGALVTNPPYGVRVGARRELGDLYARLGQVARQQLSGWSVTLLLPSFPLEQETGLRFREVFHTSNGGIRVRALTTLAGEPGRT